MIGKFVSEAKTTNNHTAAAAAATDKGNGSREAREIARAALPLRSGGRSCRRRHKLAEGTQHGSAYRPDGAFDGKSQSVDSSGPCISSKSLSVLQVRRRRLSPSPLTAFKKKKRGVGGGNGRKVFSLHYIFLRS